MVAKDNWSLCINDFAYRGDAGRAEMYNFSYGRMRRFFLGKLEGSAGPISSSDDESVAAISRNLSSRELLQTLNIVRAVRFGSSMIVLVLVLRTRTLAR